MGTYRCTIHDPKIGVFMLPGFYVVHLVRRIIFTRFHATEHPQAALVRQQIECLPPIDVWERPFERGANFCHNRGSQGSFLANEIAVYVNFVWVARFVGYYKLITPTTANICFEYCAADDTMDGLVESMFTFVE